MDKFCISLSLLIFLGLFIFLFLYAAIFISALAMYKDSKDEEVRLLKEEKQIKSLRKSQKAAVDAMNKLRKEPIKWTEL